ncbi:DNA-binding transcriptional LysR family regulator [Saccharothrix tamanrassetensis]|uniref:DNA-binding transcriptional LysR family regulator n=1 Tax=Saccharothrix tamanrassetensis TaxID=1051531 RepID=A0A841CIH5_9PSEU|nr:hypothetical protein [Saccharothrix tamanrassetensis]MBB5957099.1 DNA-binding transcriptional LysR family regulator [Saccharothrix tamanrassetensis]
MADHDRDRRRGGGTTDATGHSHPHPGIRYLPPADAGPVTVHLVWPRRPTHPATLAFREHVAALLGRAVHPR